MRRKGLLILLALVAVVSLVVFAACGKEAEPPPSDVWQYPDRLIFVASGTVSPVYPALVGWTTPWAQDTGVTVRIISETDTRLQEQWVKEGRMFVKSPHQNRGIMYGNKGFARRDWGPYQSRLFYPAGISYWGFTALGDSGIITPHDIKPGMATVWISLSEEPQQNVFAVLGWANVNPKDITFVPVSTTTKNREFLMTGQVDFCLGYHTTPGWYEAEAGPHGLRWIAMDAKADPAGAQRFLHWYPWTSFGIATAGVPSSEGVPMPVNISPYITREESDPELVYRMVKWLDENYALYKDANPWCATMTIDNVIKWATDNYEPLHEGLIRYLEEKGLWTPELQARQDYNIELLQEWIDAYAEAIAMADDQGILVNPDNKDWVTLWENYRASQGLPLLVYFQGPGKTQPTYESFFDEWNAAKPVL